MSGKIVAISTNDEDDVPKMPHDYCASIEKNGLLGDYRGNRSGIILLDASVIRYINDTLSEQLVEGSLGENITTGNMEYLSQIPKGAFLDIGEKVTLLVEEQDPLIKYHPALHNLLSGHAGILCSVFKGIGKRIVLEDPITVL